MIIGELYKVIKDYYGGNDEFIGKYIICLSVFDNTEEGNFLVDGKILPFINKELELCME